MADPLFSVVMPTYRRPDALACALRAWEAQAGSLPFEVVVVDDGSDDGPNGTVDLLKRHRPRRHGWRFASQPNAGPARARNRALAMARGAVVLFVGDDIEPTPTLLDEHWAAHQHHDDPTTVILGLTRWPPTTSVTATMRHIDGPGAQQFSYHYLQDGETYDFRHFYTSNVSIRRVLLDREPDHFSTDFPSAAFEDAELADRLAAHGARIVYRDAPVAYHHHHYDAAGFFRRQHRCGQMGAILFAKRPALAKHLRTRELAWSRLALLDSSADRRRQSATVAGDLDRWTRRLLSLASFYDPIDPPGIDPLLTAVFQYGYDAGLAVARHGEREGNALAAFLLLRDVVPAVRRWARHAHRADVPVPEADLKALLSLDTVTMPGR